MQKMDTHEHNVNKLKEIERKHQDIVAYVDIEDPDTLFLGSLPEESISNDSNKKWGIKILEYKITLIIFVKRFFLTKLAIFYLVNDILISLKGVFYYHFYRQNPKEKLE